MTGDRVEISCYDDGWRWRFVGQDASGAAVELPANEPASSLAEAVKAARTAYPDLPLDVPDDADGSGRTGAGEPQPAGRDLRLLLAAVVVMAAVTLLMVRRRGRACGECEAR